MISIRSSRMYYAASTMICIPTSLDRPIEERLSGLGRLGQDFALLSDTQGGFAKVRKATETPFNMVLEARP